MSTNDEKYKYSSQDIIGGYTLVRPLGKGHFSEVWLGQKENKRGEEEEENKPENVAIKIFTDSVLGQMSKEDFLQEGKTLQEFDHYHIVTVIDFGIDKESGGIPYIIMRKEGGNLRKLYPEGTIVSLKKVVSYVNKIAAALLYAHGRDVIHRDIKPTNILQINKQRAQEEDGVRVSDFGIA